MDTMQSWLSGVGKQVVGAVAGSADSGESKAADTCHDNEALEQQRHASDSDDADAQADGSGTADNANLVADEEARPVPAVLSGDLLGQLRDKTLSGLSAATTVSRCVTEGAKSLAKTIEANSMLGEFDSEQRRWTTEVHARSGPRAAVPPWVGYNEETLMKKQILALSLDTRNFLRDPPEGADFKYDGEAAAPVALATLDEDPNLRKMRFQLVPKKVSEERFWRNYFYRVSLIKQSAQLSSLAATTGNREQRAAESGDAAGAGVSGVLSTSDDGDAEPDAEPHVSEEELDKVRHQLGLANSSAPADVDDAAVEQQILSDLNDYELVSDEADNGGGGGGAASAHSDKDLEREIDELIDDERGGEKEGKK